MVREFILSKEKRNEQLRRKRQSKETKEDKYRNKIRCLEYDSLERKLAPLTELKCIWCGDTFSSRKSTALYCSQWCRRRIHWYRRKKAGLCPKCGKKVERNGTYCKDCIEKMRKRFNPNNGTPGIPKDGKCERCGRDYSGPRSFHWHHIIDRYISNDDSDDNLMLLCIKCHNKARNEVYRFLLERFISEIEEKSRIIEILTEIILKNGGKNNGF